MSSIHTNNFVQLCKSQAQSVGPVRTASRVQTDPLAVQPRGLDFGFVTQVAVFVEEKDNPVVERRISHETSGLRAFIALTPPVLLHLIASQEWKMKQLCPGCSVWQKMFGSGLFEFQYLKGSQN